MPRYTTTSTEAPAKTDALAELKKMTEALKAFAAKLPPPVRMVGNAWLLEHHTSDMYERDARGIATRLKSGVPAPGLYFQSWEAYDAVVRDPRMRMYATADVMDGATRLAGITVRIATAAEWAWFEHREVDEMIEHFEKQGE